MPHLLIRHRVKDYAAWRPIFDEHGQMRRQGGERAARVFQTADDPNDLVMLFEWDTAENARAFFGSEDLRAAMARAGVAGAPDIVYLNEVT